MPLFIENTTHWRTPDIEKLVRGAMKAGCADMTRRYDVTVSYNVKRVQVYSARLARSGKVKRHKLTNVSKIDIAYDRRKWSTSIEIKLPKVGPRTPHHNAMIAIASATAAPTDGLLLAPSASYELANRLTECFWVRDIEDGAHTKEREALIFNAFYAVDMPPFWGKGSDALICKVKDPLQDGTYRDFVKKKETALKRAETAIEKALSDIDSAKRRLKKAQVRKKEIEHSLKSAKERRG